MEFKRLLEFCNNLPPSTSLDDIQNRLPEGLKQAPQAFEPYEKSLQRLDPDNWEFIKQKLQSRLKKHPVRGWAQFFDTLSEVMGFCFLLDEGYEDVKFIPETTVRTPDIEGSKSQKVAVLLESKTIGFSDDERNYILENSRRMFSGSELILQEVATGMSEALKNKITNTITSAKDQLLNYLQTDKSIRRIVYLTIQLDTNLILDPMNLAEVINFLKRLTKSETEVEIVINSEVSTV
ncbi:MAG: hypothetical protein HYU80_03180 [Candidatus Blackburnbacteria bacterium]|nr:hypothetical protein [Candidatus Blackburnbacteria bacterium]